MNFVNLLGAGPFSSVISDTDTWEGISWLKSIATFMDNMIIPITIIVSVLGAIWVIWLGIQLAKAEDASHQKDARTRLINVVIAIVFVIVLMWVLTVFAAYSGQIFETNPIPTT